MRAGDLMRREFRIIHPDATLAEIVTDMDPLDGEWAPVCEGSHLIGMIRYDDIATRVGLGNGGPATLARDLLADEACYCFESTRLSEAADLMIVSHVESLPVVTAAGDLVGMLSRGDIPREGLAAED